jgi:hypothetical protein
VAGDSVIIAESGVALPGVGNALATTGTIRVTITGYMPEIGLFRKDTKIVSTF